jgi:uncharacterized membrane protein YcjF (UPF0283 family)
VVNQASKSRSSLWRFWVDAGLAVTSAAALVVTLLWHDWIEIVFRVNPDRGSGATEWLIVAVAAAITCASSLLARLEWRRARLV